MADERIFEQDFSINDSITRSVTIYPTRAAIIRDIENVTIKPGTNIITLHNVSSLLEEHSIKIDGHGMDGIVTEMVVDIVPNRIQPPSQGESDTEVDSESEDEDDLKSAELNAASASVRTGERELGKAQSQLKAYESQLSYLKLHMDSITSTPGEHPVSVETRTKDLQEYHNTRTNLEEACQTTRDAIKAEEKKLSKLCKKEKRLQDAFDRDRKADRESRNLRRLARSDCKEERQDAILKALDEVYRVRITVESQTLPKDTNTVDASIDRGRPKEKRDDDNQPTGPYLRVSYITNGASWTPQYDLRLDTVDRTGVLTYRAIYHNRTGELWKDAAITLSTSQNSFSGLDDKVPDLPPWHVTLLRRSGGHTGGVYAPGERELIVDSVEAIDPGVREAPPPAVVLERQRSKLMASSSYAMATSAPRPRMAIKSRKSVRPLSFSRSDSSANVFDAYDPTIEDIYIQNKLRSSAMLGEGGPAGASNSSDEDDGDDDDDDGGATLSSDINKLRLATTATASYGTTTTYALPGLRTFPSSSQARRHIISESDLPGIDYTHIAVPKFRTAAFLNARVPLPPDVSILPGTAGLTLDGSFLGHTALPRCVGGESFPLSLGIDQALKIRYPKPAKKSGTASRNIVMKEKVVTYTRSVVIVNSRTTPVKLTVKDQVPVSEKEALRIAVLSGRLDEGVPGRVRWGKKGEVVWELELNDRGSWTLPLEWEARMPSDMDVENGHRRY